MAYCVEKMEHKECGSSDALQVFVDDDDVISAYCFACSTYVPDPYSDKEEGYRPEIKIKSPEDIQNELNEISALKSRNLPDRRLMASTLAHFGIRVGLSEQDGVTPASHFYPYYEADRLVGYKCRIVEGKRMFALGSTTKADLFNWHNAIATGAPRLYITEGEVDAATVYQVLTKKQKGTQWEENRPAVVSLKNGSGSARRALSDWGDQIRRRFKEVVLVFDMDEAGRHAVEEATLAYPEAKSVDLPDVDPNACLLNGKEQALVNALLFSASKPKNTSIVTMADLVEKAVAPVEAGYSWPFKQMTSMTRGLRLGEVIYFGAGVKMGKSELVSTFAVHFAMEHNLPVYCAGLETPIIKATKQMAGKVRGKIYHDPDVQYDPDDLRQDAAMVGDKIHFCNSYQHAEWTNLRADILSAVEEHGARIIVIDPVTNLTAHVGSSEADSVLRAACVDMAAMAKDLDISFLLFCHLKAPQVGLTHEAGGRVHSTQFTGSRAMMRSCNAMWGLEGDKRPEDDNGQPREMEERNVRRLVLLEDREYGQTGIINLYWDSKTQLFNEMEAR